MRAMHSPPFPSLVPWLPGLVMFLASASLPAAPVINEIHYNNDVNYVLNEFVEIHNPADGQEVDLGGWKLTGGIEFTFPAPTVLPAGGYVVVASEPSVISSAFGVTALGPYVGGLSGAGEEIELLDATGTRIDRVDYGVNFPWPTRADGGGSSMELINPALDNDLGSSWRSSSAPNGSLAAPTPGTVNTVASETAPPNIRQVQHLPEQPNESETVTITAKVTDPEGVAAVTLQYRPVAPGFYIPANLPKSTSELLSNPNGPLRPNPAYRSGWISIPMVDDGTGGDAVAGDSIYSATLDAFPNRTLVRYRIRVEDAGGTAETVPYLDDESLNFAYYVYNGIPDYVANTRSAAGPTPYTHPAAVIQSLPAYHLITRQVDYDQCVAYSGSDQIPSNNFDARSAFNWTGTFVYNGKVYDNIQYRLRQRNARYSGSGKRSFRFRFNRGHYVQFHDMWGNPYPTKWRTLNSHKMNARGGTNFGLYEAINSILWNTTGTPAPYAHWFHFRVVKGSQEAPTANNGQYFGDFYGFLLGMEDYDSRFLEAHNLEDGNLYKLKSYILEGTEIIRYQAPNGVRNGSDYENIINNLRRARPDSWLRSHVNWDSWYHYHAICDAVRHYDVQPNTGEHLKNRAYYFQPDPRNRYGLLNVLPWDSDTSWGPNWNGGVDFCKDAMTNKPVFTLEYKNVVREISDLLWQRDQIYGLIDMLEDQIEPFQRADRDRWTSAPAQAGSQSDGPVTDRSRDMKIFSFVGRKSWTGGNDGNQEAISRDDNISGQRGRAAYLMALAADSAIPSKPTLTDLSAEGHPANGLRFQSSAFSDNSGTFAAMEYRIAEYGSYAGDKQMFPLEWTASWESGELDSFTGEIVPPASAVRGGLTYRARVRHQDNSGRWSNWSDPVTFVASDPDVTIYQQSLVISEIHYNPPGADDTEFLELRNISSNPVDLTDVRFTKGIDFDFAPGTILDPGAFLLVVRNQAAFEALYGTGLPVAGEYQYEVANNLDNAGETIKLALGTLAIHEFAYDDDPPWPLGADAGGYSLELASTTDHAAVDPLDPLGHGVYSNWRPSSALGGSPGTHESHGFPGPDPDADEDGDLLTAFLEYALGSDDDDPASGPGLFAAARDGDALTFSFQRNLSAEGVEFLVEVSTDLVTWTPGAVLLGEEPNGDGTSWVTYKSPDPFPAHGQLFMRLRINQLDPLP